MRLAQVEGRSQRPEATVAPMRILATATGLCTRGGNLGISVFAGLAELHQSAPLVRPFATGSLITHADPSQRLSRAVAVIHQDPLGRQVGRQAGPQPPNSQKNQAFDPRATCTSDNPEQIAPIEEAKR